MPSAHSVLAGAGRAHRGGAGRLLLRPLPGKPHIQDRPPDAV